MQVLSVNIGSLQLLPEGKSQSKTGIFKVPVDGAVRVGRDGLEGDKIANKKYHGGPGQAVYVYSAEDYSWWEDVLGRSLPLGIFGENLTVSSFEGSAPRVGDIWRIGEVEIQMTAPRIPCSKLAARMDDPAFVKTFVKANRGGAYARVLQPGPVSAGWPVTVTRAAPESPTVDDLFALWHQRDKDPELLRRALASPLAERARAALEKWLASASR